LARSCAPQFLACHRTVQSELVLTSFASHPGNNRPRRQELHFVIHLLFTRAYGTDQCAPSSAWKLAIPESNDPMIAVVASARRGKSIWVIEAMKIAAIGRAMTK